LHQKHKKPMPVAVGEVGKNYVTFTTWVVYGSPNLLSDVSAKLKVADAGQVCFNFRSVDEAAVLPT